MKIGIIGLGIVGTAVKAGVEKAGHQLIGYDVRDPDVPSNKFENVLASDLVFLCLPTPTTCGKQDLAIILGTVRNLDALNYQGLIVIKSTVLPGTTDMLRNKFPGLKFVVNPEFLTERTAVKDFLSQKKALIGGHDEDAFPLLQFYEDLKIPTKLVAPKEAEFVKYTANVYFAAKVSIMNEIYSVISHSKVDYRTVVDTVSEMTGWLNTSHTQVPGPDGKYGYGGNCFIKDTDAFIAYAQNKRVATPILATSYLENKRRRHGVQR